MSEKPHGSDSPRLLILMRHAQAADQARTDKARPLTERGHEQARSVGRWLAQQGVRIDHALVSSAVRTRETFADLRLDCEVELLDGLYNATSEQIEAVVREAPAEARTLLIIAHNPGIHGAVIDLAELAGRADAERIVFGFPTATSVGIDVAASWADLSANNPLDFVHLP